MPNCFNPQAIARNVVLNRVRRGACHFGTAVECVHLSDVGRLVSGYDTFSGMVADGTLALDAKGNLSIARAEVAA